MNEQVDAMNANGQVDRCLMLAESSRTFNNDYAEVDSDVECLDDDDSDFLDDSDSLPDFTESNVVPPPLCEWLANDLKLLNCNFRRIEDTLGIRAGSVEESRISDHNFCCIILNFDFTGLSPSLRKYWEMEADYISIRMDHICRVHYRAGQDRPKFFAAKPMEEPSVFVLGEQLKNLASDYASTQFASTANTSHFLGDLYEMICERIKKATEYCIICNEKLRFAGIMPSICDRPLCTYQCEELGLFDGLMIPRVPADELDLLFSLFNAANVSSRRDLILTPTPQLRDEQFEAFGNEIKVMKASMDEELAKAKTPATGIGEEGDGLSGHGLRAPWAESHRFCHQSFEQAKTITKVIGSKNFGSTPRGLFEGLARNIPCIRSFMSSPQEYREFRAKFPVTGKFIEWLVITNKTYLLRVPVTMTLGFLKTPYQFIIVADTPSKQELFETRKRENNGQTRFLFHGSPFENWHSIMRNGLKVMSGTKFMTTGAAYGNGIYLSDSARLSRGYSMRYSTQQNQSPCKRECCLNRPPLPGRCAYALAIIEVVDHPTILRQGCTNIFVLENEEYASVRMLLLPKDVNHEFCRFESQSAETKDSLSVDDAEHIRNLVDHFKNSPLDQVSME